NTGNWPDRNGSEPAVVGLCVMAFLAHGEDPNHGPYAGNIRRGIEYIMDQQNSGNGYIGSSMYNHGFATLSLAEAYGVLRDDRVAQALKKAVDLILSAQERNPRGAWRYTPESPDADTTVTGAQMVALFAARNAGLPVPDEALKKGQAFLKRC
ncbi:MAG: squalene--hopene cyclase, partial [Akkermansiaceae bacterium]|nr:squalene--hopene cyclase [Akkermansiaceae bacterium]